MLLTFRVWIFKSATGRYRPSNFEEESSGFRWQRPALIAGKEHKSERCPHAPLAIFLLMLNILALGVNTMPADDSAP